MNFEKKNGFKITKPETRLSLNAWFYTQSHSNDKFTFKICKKNEVEPLYNEHIIVDRTNSRQILNEEFIQEFQNSDPSCFLIINKEGMIIEASTNALKLLDLSHDEVFLKPMGFFITPEYQYLHRQLFSQLLETKVKQVGIVQMLRKKIHPFWTKIEIEITLNRDNGDPPIIRGILSTITGFNPADPLKKACLELIEMISKNSILTNESSLHTPDNHCLYTKITELTKELTSVNHSMKEKRDEYKRIVNKFVKIIINQKMVATKKKALDTMNGQLQRTESLRVMAGAIAHKFNNILSVIMGNLDLAMSLDHIEPETGKFISEAFDASKKAAEICHLLLTYLGQCTGNRKTLDLSEICRQYLKITRFINHENINIEEDLPFPGPLVKVNEPELQQIIMNLTINSCESIGDVPGTIHISVKTVSRDEIPLKNIFPQDWKPEPAQTHFYACLEVSDTGCGILEKSIERIFDPFFTSKFTGRGLGLPVVLGILKRYSGVVSVQSDEGIGSVFKIYLPVSEEIT